MIIIITIEIISIIIMNLNHENWKLNIDHPAFNFFKLFTFNVVSFI